MRSPPRKKYEIRYFSSSNKDEDNETNEDTETNENTKTNDDAKTDDDTKTNDDTEADDDAETDDDTEAIEDTNNDKIESAISALDRPMRSAVARKTPRKSRPYHTKQWDLVEMKLLTSDKIILSL